MPSSDSGKGNVDGALHSGEVGGGLTLIYSGIPPVLSVVAYFKCDGEIRKSKGESNLGNIGIAVAPLNTKIHRPRIYVFVCAFDRDA